MTTEGERNKTEANARVDAWASLTLAERTALLQNVEPLASGGAMLTINGVDRWIPSRRDAADELVASYNAGVIR